jgi:hypothetical protein
MSSCRRLLAARLGAALHLASVQPYPAWCLQEAATMYVLAIQNPEWLVCWQSSILPWHHLLMAANSMN